MKPQYFKHLNERQIETLCDLLWANVTGKTTKPWVTPMEVGASNASHHSATLNSLAVRGLAQWKQRGAPDPLSGQNGQKHHGRGAKAYRITPGGIALLKEMKRA